MKETGSLLAIDVSRETSEKLEAYAALLIAENKAQNLIARSTEDDLWNRHFADAAQLLHWVPAGSWLDIGSGAGLPGLVIAILSDSFVSLVEPRRLRADFLRRAVETLALTSRAEVLQCKVEAVRHAPFDVITARAVASLPRLFAMAAHLSHKGTTWVLPKGRSAKSELDEARRTWQGSFRLEPSRTDPDAQILVATGVRGTGARGVT
jgi:16S rRNA (guanine527-N7)-methyltransferase